MYNTCSPFASAISFRSTAIDPTGDAARDTEHILGSDRFYRLAKRLSHGKMLSSSSPLLLW